MEHIRCCMISEKNLYRGIDREVTMRIFNNEKDRVAYENAYDEYLKYLSTEEENTVENFDIICSFRDFINCGYGKSEIILYAKYPIRNEIPCRFLGIDIVDLEVVDSQKIKKKAKWLYLFGGTRSFLPLFGIAILISLIWGMSLTHIPDWFRTENIILLIGFFLCLCRYIKSLKFLNEAMKEKNILKYMSSKRKEYRKFSDDLIQKQLDVNEGDDKYW